MVEPALQEPGLQEPGRHQLRKAATRDRITRTANRLFQANGYAGTSMDEISTAADVAIRTLYLHFDSKAAILLAYFDEWLEEFVRLVGERPAGERLDITVERALTTMASAGWDDDKRVEDVAALHPVVEFIGGGAPEIAGHIMQRWVAAQDKLTESFRVTALPPSLPGWPRRRVDARHRCPRDPVVRRRARLARLGGQRVGRGAVVARQKTKLGYGLDAGTTMGPIHSPVQKAFVDELIEEAKASGADVREFGELPGGDLAGGNFVRPAIVVDPDPNLRVVTYEQFGPVIPIMPFETEDEAVTTANDTWGGLCGSVWTANPETADRVGSQLVCGYVWVNDHGAPRLDLRAPFGGMKQSGIGREQGLEGVRAFQDSRSISHLDAATLAAMAH